MRLRRRAAARLGFARRAARARPDQAVRVWVLELGKFGKLGWETLAGKLGWETWLGNLGPGPREDLRSVEDAGPWGPSPSHATSGAEPPPASGSAAHASTDQKQRSGKALRRDFCASRWRRSCLCWGLLAARANVSCLMRERRSALRSFPDCSLTCRDTHRRAWRLPYRAAATAWR